MAVSLLGSIKEFLKTCDLMFTKLKNSSNKTPVLYLLLSWQETKMQLCRL